MCRPTGLHEVIVTLPIQSEPQTVSSGGECWQRFRHVEGIREPGHEYFNAAVPMAIERLVPSGVRGERPTVIASIAPLRVS